MSDCISDATGRRCIHCGRAWPLPGKFGHRVCREPIPARTPAEIAALRAICRSNECGAFDWHPRPEHDACRLCGCASKRAAAWEARLLRGRCPKGEW